MNEIKNIYIFQKKKCSDTSASQSGVTDHATVLPHRGSANPGVGGVQHVWAASAPRRDAGVTAGSPPPTPAHLLAPVIPNDTEGRVAFAQTAVLRGRPQRLCCFLLKFLQDGRWAGGGWGGHHLHPVGRRLPGAGRSGERGAEGRRGAEARRREARTAVKPQNRGLQVTQEAGQLPGAGVCPSQSPSRA